MRRLVCENRSAWLYFGLGEADAFSLALENISQRPTIALPQGNDAAARIFPMSLEAPIDAIGSRVGGANMAAKIRSVDLHSPIEPETLCLACERLSDLMGQNEGRFIGQASASRELERSYARKLVTA